VHYAPAENLEHIDIPLIDTARQEIDLAAYVLTDWTIIEALTRAANRGVTVRIYLDGTQLAERELTKVFQRGGQIAARRPRTIWGRRILSPTLKYYPSSSRPHARKCGSSSGILQND
jgi:phosphatidylserine/phosphatidylglycerophosphate/cardiolipin synthase-like enzyme